MRLNCGYMASIRMQMLSSVARAAFSCAAIALTAVAETSNGLLGIIEQCGHSELAWAVASDTSVVSDNEVDSVHHELEACLGSDVTSREEIRYMLRASKIVEKGAAITLGRRETEATTDELLTQYQVEKQECIDAIRPIINAHALLQIPANSSAVVAEGLRIRSAARPRSTWEEDSLILGPGFPERLAWDDRTNTCILSRADFNEAIPLLPVMRTITSLDSARSELLRQCLVITYYFQLAAQKGYLAADSQALVSVINNLYRGPGKGVSMSELERLYEYRYRDHYSKCEEIYVQIIGSTDSSVVDALSRRYTKRVDSHASTSARATGSPHSAIRDELPEFEVKEIDRRLMPLVDTLSIGPFCRTTAAPFSYLSLRISRVRSRNEISFHEAFNELVLLATANQYNAELARGQNATRTRTQRRDRLRLADTIQVYLLPSAACSTKAYPRDSICRAESSAGRLMQVGQLPCSVRFSIDTCAEDKSGWRGPVQSPYGVWYCRKLRPAHTATPANMFDTLWADCPSNSSEPATLSQIAGVLSSDICFRKAVADSYKAKLDQELRNTTICAAWKNRTELDPEEGGVESDAIVNELYESYRKTTQQRAAEFAEWLEHISIAPLK